MCHVIYEENASFTGLHLNLFSLQANTLQNIKCFFILCGNFLIKCTLQRHLSYAQNVLGINPVDLNYPEDHP